VWLNADCPHAYGSSDADPWTISWAHFAGDEAADWRSQLGLPSSGDVAVGSLPEDRASELKLERVHGALERGYSLHQLILAAVALRSSFCAAIQLVRLDGSARPASKRVAAVVERIRESPETSWRLKDLAAAAHLSIPHFSDLFRRQTGYAPIDYLIRQRIQRASQLLDTTEAPIAAIAGEAGYSDPYYFARSFRSVMGVSPRAYRRVVKG
jgi:AraC-like DNA-binding protein